MKRKERTGKLDRIQTNVLTRSFMILQLVFSFRYGTNSPSPFPLKNSCSDVIILIRLKRTSNSRSIEHSTQHSF